MTLKGRSMVEGGGFPCITVTLLLRTSAPCAA